jgi:hypothetical protein
MERTRGSPAESIAGWFLSHVDRKLKVEHVPGHRRVPMTVFLKAVQVQQLGVAQVCFEKNDPGSHRAAREFGQPSTCIRVALQPLDQRGPQFIPPTVRPRPHSCFMSSYTLQ